MPEEAEGTETEEQPTENEQALADRLAAVEARLAGQSRETVLSSVIPADALATPVGQFFAQNYQGEITPAAVTTEAVRLGLIADPAAGNQEGNATDAERAAHEASLDLRHSGIPAEGLAGQHPNEVAREAAKGARRMGTEDEALGAYIESHARSILTGDSRSRIDLFAGAGAVRGR